ncbi:MAG TPA: hypothetical protein VMZ53_19135 [Kofleriaceae bacterium]|nr:hypothetical protein [Kofleriaceae bacterium]
MAGRTHAQQLANHTLLQQVSADPLSLTRAIAAGEGERVLQEIWQKAAYELAPIARMPGVGLSATMERHGLYTVVQVMPPPPRESGDPAAIVIIGRGDGSSKLSGIGYYVLSLVLDAVTGAPRFTFASRDARNPKAVVTVEGPLPDPAWLMEYASALYEGIKPEPRNRQAEVPTLPSWYWWYAFEARDAMKFFADAETDPDRFDAVRRFPILLMPEIADAGEALVGEKPAKKLRELRPYLRRDPSMAPAWKGLAERLANTTGGAPGAHTTRAIELLAEPREHGALTKPAAYELEAFVRCKLALLGIEPDENNRIAQELAVAAARDSQPIIMPGGKSHEPAEDPLWLKLFLDDTDLPNWTLSTFDEEFANADPTFLHFGGARAAFVVWSADESSAMAHLMDTRWVFRTNFGAQSYLREPATLTMLADGVPPVPAPELGDEAIAFGGTAPDGRRTQILVIRIGRVLARIQANEGINATAARQILHAAVLHPLGIRVAQRGREGIAAYWLNVAAPTNAVPALLHSPGYDVARLIEKYPLLAHSELPRAIATLGGKYEPVARSLASYQAQLRAHRWQTYRSAMLALVKALVETDMGDTRVNAAFALEIVYELGHIDPDPVWRQLAVTCEARL